jgi:UDP-N-acetylmuramate dehydrogenase
MTENDTQSLLSHASQITIVEAYRRSFGEAFGERFREQEPLGRHTSARIGGPADYFVEATSADDLVAAARLARGAQLPLLVLGGGSNVLVADAGVRGLVVLNRAQTVQFRHDGMHVVLRAESGVFFAPLARQCVQRGLAGLEWGVGVPGTVGGAVFGNAGAHGGDVAGVLRRAGLLDPDGQLQELTAEELRFDYRASALKRARGGRPGRAAPGRPWLVLWVEFNMVAQPADELAERAARYTEHRKATQPPGASLGSMFKNPPGDYAGRLIEAARLKGERRGQAEISRVHANFFVNHGGASAADVLALIALARDTVRAQSGVTLELEVELVGDWTAQATATVLGQ